MHFPSDMKFVQQVHLFLEAQKLTSSSTNHQALIDVSFQTRDSLLSNIMLHLGYKFLLAPIFLYVAYFP